METVGEKVPDQVNAGNVDDPVVAIADDGAGVFVPEAPAPSEVTLLENTKDTDESSASGDESSASGDEPCSGSESSEEPVREIEQENKERSKFPSRRTSEKETTLHKIEKKGKGKEQKKPAKVHPRPKQRAHIVLAKDSEFTWAAFGKYLWEHSLIILNFAILAALMALVVMQQHLSSSTALPSPEPRVPSNPRTREAERLLQRNQLYGDDSEWPDHQQPDHKRYPSVGGGEDVFGGVFNFLTDQTYEANKRLDASKRDQGRDMVLYAHMGHILALEDSNRNNRGPNIDSNNRDDSPRESPLVFVTQGLDFVRGYLRMRLACEDLQRMRAWYALDQNGGASYGQSLYLSSTSPFSPYFCVNLNLHMLMKADAKDGAICDVMNAKEIDERDLGSLCQWRRFLQQGTAAPSLYASVTTSTAFAYHELYHTRMLGYNKYDFVTRPLEALGHYNQSRLASSAESEDAAPEYGPVSMSYNRLTHLVAELYDELRGLSTGGELCICGPHLNMARNIVAYVSSKHRKANLYIEPVIISPARETFGVDATKNGNLEDGDEDNRILDGVIRSAVPSKPLARLAWVQLAEADGAGGGASPTADNNSDDHDDVYDNYDDDDEESGEGRSRTSRLKAYLAADRTLRQHLLKTLPSGVESPNFLFGEMVIDSVDFNPEKNIIGNTRRLDNIRDAEAACVHYCTHMAYSLATRGMALQSSSADRYASKIGVDIYLGKAPIPKTLLLFGQTIATRFLYNASAPSNPEASPSPGDRKNQKIKKPGQSSPSSKPTTNKRSP